jgi:tRNA C32,U32 (ribose-2'-O)-methylase TrmJ
MLSSVRIVLVRPRGSGNIGSIARAMKNFGASELAIVGKARTQSFWARAMAVHGRDILAEAKLHPTIRAAIADCTLVVGTTCRAGLYRKHSQPPRVLAAEIVAAARRMWRNANPAKNARAPSATMMNGMTLLTISSERFFGVQAKRAKTLPRPSVSSNA